MIHIDFSDKINCLIAKKEPIKLALYQPKLDLLSSDLQGPQYSTDEQRADVIEKIQKFLELAKRDISELIVFPEYSVPLEMLKKVCSDKNLVLPGTLLIMPLEAISSEIYDNIQNELSTVDHCNCHKLDVNHSRTIGFINVCAIVAVYSDEVNVFLQPKRHSARLEEKGLLEGSDYYVFEGDYISLTVLICSDANEPVFFREQLRETIRATRSCFVIHTQWNPDSIHTVYDSLWRDLISTSDGCTNVLISVNAASGSRMIYNANTYMIDVPYVRVACGGDGHRDEKYMNAMNVNSFKSLYENGKYGQILNFVYPDECAHIATIKRPYEGPSLHPAVSSG